MTVDYWLSLPPSLGESIQDAYDNSDPLSTLTLYLGEGIHAQEKHSVPFPTPLLSSSFPSNFISTFFLWSYQRLQGAFTLIIQIQHYLPS